MINFSTIFIVALATGGVTSRSANKNSSVTRGNNSLNHSERYAQMLADFYAQHNHKGANVHKKFVELSTLWSILNWDESVKLAKRFKCAPKQCFQNCITISVFNPALKYCEGYATNIIPTEHAWLVNAQGEVIDPTWCILNDKFEPDYFGMVLNLKHLPHKAFEPGWLPTVLKHIKRRQSKNGREQKCKLNLQTTR